MKLWSRILLLIILIFFSLLVLVYGVSSFGLQRSIYLVEEENARKDIQRINAVLDNELTYLDNIVSDWATWDDTYNFVQDVNEEYIETNIVDSSFVSLKINLLLFINSSGEVVSGSAYDLNDNSNIPVPPGIEEHISPDSPLIYHQDIAGNTGGIILLSEGPMLVASSPILDSQREGPIRGTLIMGRYLDSAKLKEIAHMSQVSLSMYCYREPGLPIEIAGLKPSFSVEKPVIIKVLNQDAIAGYTFINDIYQQPALVCKVIVPRPGYQLGQQGLRVFMVIIVVYGLMLAGIMLWALNRWGLSRLNRLGIELMSVGMSQNLSTRVSVQGKDEITKLAGDVNNMLEALEQAQTSRRLAETALQLSEANFRNSLNNSPLGVNIVNNKGESLYVNHTLLDMYGFESAEEFNRTPRSKRYTPESFAEFQVIEDKRLKGEATLPNYEISIVCKGGEVRRLVVFSSEVWWNGTNRFQCLYLDITERRQAEEMQRKMNEYQELDALKTAILSTVSHELRTPLAAIKGYASLMLRYDKKLKAGEKSQYLQSIDSATDRLANLVEHLLDMSRLDAGLLRIDRNLTAISDLLEKAIADARLTRIKHEIKLEIAGGLPAIALDPIRIRQVIDNLIDNAYKYSPDGTEVLVKAEKKEKEVIISVSDRGVGIPESEIGKLFNRMYRIEQRLVKDPGGLGLGLSLCKGLVEAHGGRIWVESQPGKGSTFYFSIPLESQENKTKPLIY